MDSLNRRIELLTRSPLWAMLPEAIPTMVLHLVTRPEAFSASNWEAAKPGFIGKGTNKVAIIPVQGVLTKDGPSWYGTSYDTISNAAEQAGADPAVKRVVLAVDSPGGEVTGLPETAAIVSQLAKVKPVSVIVEGMSASAAYWLSSQASDITLTPSGEVGSVGVRMMHVDVSKLLEDMGYKVTELFSGNFKTEWSPYKPLSDDAKADMQKRLDAIHTEFISAVAAGRGNRATEDIKAARFGEGRMFAGTDAISHGLVDKLMSSRDFYRAITPAQEEDPAPAFGMPRRARLELERQRS